jgi:hypothetical protein
VEHNSKVFEMSAWNVIDGYILWRRNAVRKNENSSLYNFWGIVLCCFFILFCRELISKVFEVSTWNFIGGWISLKRSEVHKNDHSTLHNFWVIALSYFSKLIFVQSITQKAFKLNRYIDLTQEVCSVQEW